METLSVQAESHASAKPEALHTQEQCHTIQLEWNNEFNSYEGELVLSQGRIRLALECVTPLEYRPQLEKLTRVITGFETRYLPMIRNYACDELLPLKNSSWLDLDDEVNGLDGVLEEIEDYTPNENDVVIEIDKNLPYEERAQAFLEKYQAAAEKFGWDLNASMETADREPAEEHPRAVTPEQFKSALQPYYVCVKPSEEVYFEFEDGDMFLGHVIRLAIDADDRLLRAEI